MIAPVSTSPLPNIHTNEPAVISQPAADPLQPPIFVFQDSPPSMFAMWKEFTEGSEDGLGVRGLEERWGSKWCRPKKLAMAYSRRNTIWSFITMRAAELNVAEDVIVGKMETFRIEKELSAAAFTDMIKNKSKKATLADLTLVTE